MIGRARRLAGEDWSRSLTNASHRSRTTALRRQIVFAQYVSIKYTVRLAEAGIEPSAGSVGDSYDCDRFPQPDGLTHATIDCVSLR